MPAKNAKTSTQPLTAEERAAMKEHVAEVRAAARRGGSAAEKAAADAQALVDKITELEGDDRTLAEWVHGVITRTAPGLAPKLWYGMPAYYQGGRPIVFFQPAGKFKARYGTLGFNDGARLDDGSMWPTSYALTKVNGADEKTIAALIRKAAG
jgi:uncharacterized protein YdhG (YjbR/CyaY superfamily)